MALFLRSRQLPQLLQILEAADAADARPAGRLAGAPKKARLWVGSVGAGPGGCFCFFCVGWLFVASLWFDLSIGCGCFGVIFLCGLVGGCSLGLGNEFRDTKSEQTFWSSRIRGETREHRDEGAFPRRVPIFGLLVWEPFFANWLNPLQTVSGCWQTGQG